MRPDRCHIPSFSYSTVSGFHNIINNYYETHCRLNLNTRNDLLNTRYGPLDASRTRNVAVASSIHAHDNVTFYLSANYYTLQYLII